MAGVNASGRLCRPLIRHTRLKRRRNPRMKKGIKNISMSLPVLVAIALLGPVRAQDNQNKKPTTLREVLLSELRSTHTNPEWFVPANTAVKGLTAEQASWSDGKGNHSVGQLAYHIVFWNRQNLARLKGEKPAPFGGNNDETFTKFDT